MATELESIVGELDRVIAEEPDSYTVRADFDNLRCAIARKSMEMARAIDDHPQLYEVVRKMVQGFRTYARVHGIEHDDVEVRGFMTPEGNIVVQLSHDPWAALQ